MQANCSSGRQRHLTTSIICRDCFYYTLSRSCKHEHHWMGMSRDPHFACPCSTQRQPSTVRIHTRTTQAIRNLSTPIQFSGTTEPDAIRRRGCGEGASGRALCYGGGGGSLIPSGWTTHSHATYVSDCFFACCCMASFRHAGSTHIPGCLGSPDHGAGAHSLVKRANCRNLIKTLLCC